MPVDVVWSLLPGGVLVQSPERYRHCSRRRSFRLLRVVSFMEKLMIIVIQDE